MVGEKRKRRRKRRRRASPDPEWMTTRELAQARAISIPSAWRDIQEMRRIYGEDVAKPRMLGARAWGWMVQTSTVAHFYAPKEKELADRVKILEREVGELKASLAECEERMDSMLSDATMRQDFERARPFAYARKV